MSFIPRWKTTLHCLVVTQFVTESEAKKKNQDASHETTTKSGEDKKKKKKKTSVDAETPVATFHCQSVTSDEEFGRKLSQGELTEGLQAVLHELLPTRPLGQVSKGHGGLARCRLCRAGLVEPVRAARRRDPRPGAAAWCPSPSEQKAQVK